MLLELLHAGFKICSMQCRKRYYCVTVPHGSTATADAWSDRVGYPRDLVRSVRHHPSCAQPRFWFHLHEI